VVLIAADAEWRVARNWYGVKGRSPAPFESFMRQIGQVNRRQAVVFVRTGCGKAAAAAGTQYAIDTWHPRLLVNLGTCGGFKGAVSVGDILLILRASVYDVYERTGNALQQIRKHVITIPLKWLPKPWPSPVKIANVATADQDLHPREIPRLRLKPFNACAADWESAAEAWVARRNSTRCLIIRGVSDVVGGSPAKESKILSGSTRVMKRLFVDLSLWLETWKP
jgi:adenosylhomocysteine nucleosidase